MNRITKSKVLLLVALISLLAGMWACNFPRGYQAGQPDPAQTVNSLIQGMGIEVQGVMAQDKHITISYAQPLEGDEPGVLVTWLAILQAAQQAIPTAKSVTLQVTWLGEPYLDLSATAADLRQVKAGELDPLAFFDQHVEFEDRRPPEVQFSRKFSDPNLQVTGITSRGQTIEIDLVISPADTPQLVEYWYQVLSLAEVSFPQAQTIVLNAELEGGGSLRVEASRQDLEAYRLGRLDAAHLLLALIIAER